LPIHPQFHTECSSSGILVPVVKLLCDLAYLQMKSIASVMLLRHSVELILGHRVEQEMSLTLFMKNGLHV
jgi:hypothetical protein